MVVPTTRDAELTGTLLGKAGVECCACRDLSAVTQSLKDGAAAVLLPEELLTPAGIGSFPRHCPRSRPGRMCRFWS